MRYKRFITILAIGILVLSTYGSTRVSGFDLEEIHTIQEIYGIIEGILEVITFKKGLELTRRSDYSDHMGDLVDDLMDMFCDKLQPFILQADLIYATHGHRPILTNPMVKNILHGFIHLLQPLYALAIILTSVYIIFISGSPEGRASAKSSLIKLVLGMGVITLTQPIIELLLQVSHAFTATVLSLYSVDTNVFREVTTFFMRYFVSIAYYEEMVGSPFLLMSIMLPVSVLAVLALRYFMVILLTVFFPFTILFYSFEPVRGIGKRLLMMTFVWIFLPVMDAIVLVATWVSYTTSAIPEINVFILFAGFFMLIFAPLIMVGLTNWTGGIGFVSGVFFEPVMGFVEYFERMGIEEEGEEEEYEVIKDEVERE